MPHVLQYSLHARSKSLDFYGKVMFFFFMCSVMSWYMAFQNIILSSDKEHQISLDLFTYILPFVSFIIDASVKRAYAIQAKNFYMCFKIVVIFYYLAVYVMALQKSSDEGVYWVANGNLLGFPLLMTIYWLLLMKGYLS